jgi:hypothetical protein
MTPLVHLGGVRETGQIGGLSALQGRYAGLLSLVKQALGR